MVLDAVRKLVFWIRHVVDCVTVVMSVLTVVVAVQIIVLSKMIHHHVRHFHLVFRALHRSVEVHVRAGDRGVMIVENAAVQRYHAGDWSIDQGETDG